MPVDQVINVIEAKSLEQDSERKIPNVKPKFIQLYISNYKYYPNCRGHEEGYNDGNIKIFNNLKEFLEEALESINDREYFTIHNVNGKAIGRIKYEISNHRVSNLEFNIKWLRLKTVDNGSGVKLWKRVF